MSAWYSKMQINILLFITLISCNGAVVTPTIVNATGEYYINTHDGGSSNFSNNTITCGSETCIINCNNPKGCYETVVEPSSVKHLSITCSAENSCASLYLWSSSPNSITSFSLNCAGRYSCLETTIVILQVSDAIVECGGYGGCQSTVLTLSGANSTSITCPNTWSCSSSGGLGRIQVTNTNQATFEGDGKWAFTNMQLLINAVDTVISDCSGTKSCQSSIWNVGQSVAVGSMHHSCQTSDACDYWTLYATVTDSLSITSNAASSYQSGTRYITCSTECLNTFNCGDYILFRCADNADPMSEPVGEEDICSNCICDTAANQQLYLYWSSPYWQHCLPTTEPTYNPTMNPIPTTAAPTSPTEIPTSNPTVEPTMDPTTEPTVEPTTYPTLEPTTDTSPPSTDPSEQPTYAPTTEPTIEPTTEPTDVPTETPSDAPSGIPSMSTFVSSETPVDAASMLYGQTVIDFCVLFVFFVFVI